MSGQRYRNDDPVPEARSATTGTCFRPCRIHIPGVPERRSTHHSWTNLKKHSIDTMPAPRFAADGRRHFEDQRKVGRDLLTFSCNLNVPRTVDAVGMPTDWALDGAISSAARGFLSRLIDLAEPAVIVGEDDLGEPHPNDPPFEAMVKELVEAGYLSLSEHYRVVHPARLSEKDDNPES